MLDSMKITTVGISAGGYMATVMALLTDVDICVNVSGQWFLDFLNEKNPLLYVNRENVERGYFDLKELSKSNPLFVPCLENIFYFYPGKCQHDIEQRNYINEIISFKCAIDTEVHGSLFRKEIWPFLLTTSPEKLRNVVGKNCDKIISDNIIFRKIVPCYYRIYYRGKHMLEIIWDLKKSKHS